MCALESHISMVTTIPQNLRKSRTLVGEQIFLMESTFDEIGLTFWLLTPETRYSVSVHLKNDFSVFNFNPAPASFKYNPHKAFRLFLIIIQLTLLCQKMAQIQF